jgi:hypothetical protein
VDLAHVEQAFASFLAGRGATISTMDRTYAQRFEAYSFLHVASRLRAMAVSSGFVPEGKPVRLKYSPRGRNENYTYFSFRLGSGPEALELRHNLTVRSHHAHLRSPAAFSLDLAVVDEGAVPLGEAVIDNTRLVTFYECKNFQAFPELLASFLGLVGEMLPAAIRRGRKPLRFPKLGLDCPGLLTGGGEPSVNCYEIWRTVKRRKLLVDLWFYSPAHNNLVQATVPARPFLVAPAPKKRRKRRGAGTTAQT